MKELDFVCVIIIEMVGMILLNLEKCGMEILLKALFINKSVLILLVFNINILLFLLMLLCIN